MAHAATTQNAREILKIIPTASKLCLPLDVPQCLGASYGTFSTSGICFNSIAIMVAKNRLVGKP
jgi:hypothetical protein